MPNTSGTHGASGLGGDRIFELPVGKKKAIVHQQRYLVFSLGKFERVFRFVTDEIHALQSGINIQPIDAHRVVVVEEHRRILPVGIVEGSRLARNVPVLGVAVAVRRRLAAMKVNDTADHRQVGFGSMQGMVDGQKVVLRQLIHPFHDQSVVAAGFKSRSW